MEKLGLPDEHQTSLTAQLEEILSKLQRFNISEIEKNPKIAIEVKNNVFTEAIKSYKVF